jgi:integrase
MGQTTRGIYGPEQDGSWEVDKWWRGTRLRRCGFASYEEAEGWLIAELAKLRKEKLLGQQVDRTFDDAAAHYVLTHQDKTSLETEITLLKGVMPHIGTCCCRKSTTRRSPPSWQASRRGPRAQDHQPRARRGAPDHESGRLAVARRSWQHVAAAGAEDHDAAAGGPPARAAAHLVGRAARSFCRSCPTTSRAWRCSRLNTGVRDDVACSLRWEWEIKIPQLGVSVFEVPRAHVKGRRRVRLVVCNSVAQSIVETVRGQHPEFVFVYRRERKKNLDQAPLMKYRPIETMNNTGWQNGRKAAGLGDLHVHDLRHTVGMRLREAGVSDETAADILWHSKRSMTHHYSMAQIVELHAALEKIKADTGAWNKSLRHCGSSTQRSARKDVSPRKVPARKRPEERQLSQAVDLLRQVWCGWQDSNPRPLGS